MSEEKSVESADKKFVVVKDNERVSPKIHENKASAEVEKKKLTEGSSGNVEVKQVLLG